MQKRELEKQDVKEVEKKDQKEESELESLENKKDENEKNNEEKTVEKENKKLENINKNSLNESNSEFKEEETLENATENGSKDFSWIYKYGLEYFIMDENMVKQISKLNMDEYQKYKNNICFKYGNNMCKIKNNMYEGILNVREAIDTVRKNLYDALIIFCIPIFENEKNITEEVKLFLKFSFAITPNFFLLLSSIFLSSKTLVKLPSSLKYKQVSIPIS